MEKNGNKSVKSGVIVKRSKAPDSSYEATEARISESMQKYQEGLKVLAELIRKSKMIQTRTRDQLMPKCIKVQGEPLKPCKPLTHPPENPVEKVIRERREKEIRDYELHILRQLEEDN
ncbi:hypothetical protein Grass_61 [Bacillus phage Grass]|uniref:Uncharacterized protein n=1 Tax=Bacillus phage Grass TaxID=1406785 RepID=U5PU70_BPGRA|nr:hypothetical protein Grass_61 [Bacillus phage Grass]AGY47326.1 hypothetical protein Grass_61 [Bacillus phage Grass]